MRGTTPPPGGRGRATTSRGSREGGARGGLQQSQGQPGLRGGAPNQADPDIEIREFLEGLLEGFRAAAAANAAQGGPDNKPFSSAGARGAKGAWSDLDDLERTLPQFNIASDMRSQSRSNFRPPDRGSSPSQLGRPKGRGDSFASDPLSTMMRRHALRSFLEEMCGSVAKAFDQMAAVAMRNNSGSQGGTGQPDQRMKYKFGHDEFQRTLDWMGYGVGAGKDWWQALFRSLDVDEDGFVTLQDMYDALVLDLPPVQAGPNVFFSAGAANSTPRSVAKKAGAPRAVDNDLMEEDMPLSARPGRQGEQAWSEDDEVNADTFQKMDLNRDGKVDRREFQQGRERGLVADVCVVCETPFAKKQLFCANCGSKRPS